MMLSYAGGGVCVTLKLLRLLLPQKESGLGLGLGGVTMELAVLLVPVAPALLVRVPWFPSSASRAIWLHWISGWKVEALKLSLRPSRSA